MPCKQRIDVWEAQLVVRAAIDSTAPELKERFVTPLDEIECVQQRAIDLLARVRHIDARRDDLPQLMPHVPVAVVVDDRFIALIKAGKPSDALDENLRASPTLSLLARDGNGHTALQYVLVECCRYVDVDVARKR